MSQIGPKAQSRENFILINRKRRYSKTSNYSYNYRYPGNLKKYNFPRFVWKYGKVVIVIQNSEISERKVHEKKTSTKN